MAESNFCVEVMVKGYHVYRDIWTAKCLEVAPLMASLASHIVVEIIPLVLGGEVQRFSPIVV